MGRNEHDDTRDGVSEDGTNSGVVVDLLALAHERIEGPTRTVALDSHEATMRIGVSSECTTMPGAFPVAPSGDMGTPDAPADSSRRSSDADSIVVVTSHGRQLSSRLLGIADDAELVEAQEVTARGADLEEARPAGPDSSSKVQRVPTHWRTWVCTCYLLASLIAVVTVVTLVSRSSSGHNGGSTNRTTTGTDLPATNEETLVEDAAMAYLLKQLPEIKAAIDDTNSSSIGQAFQWLVQDPMLYTYTRNRLQQRFALASFFHATNGASWHVNTHWLSYQHHECEWYHTPYSSGLPPAMQTNDSPCNSGNTTYNRLGLSSNNLQGTVPETVYWYLPNLTSIDLSTDVIKLNRQANDWFCGMEGTISTAIGGLTNLEQLSLQGCPMSGTIPSQIGLLNRLSTLNLRQHSQYTMQLHGVDFSMLPKKSQLIGNIPSQIGLMTSLARVLLHNNELSGSIPSQIGNLESSLSVLGLVGNQLSGSLPSELGRIAGLRFLVMNDNELEGVIPSELGNLQSLSWFHLTSNRLTGALPSELSFMINLKELNMAENLLSSAVPSEVGLLGETLYMLYINDNQLSGRLPSELLQLTKLQALDLSLNPQLELEDSVILVSDNMITNGTSSTSGELLLEQEPLKSALNFSFAQYVACGLSFRCMVQP